MQTLVCVCVCMCVCIYIYIGVFMYKYVCVCVHKAYIHHTNWISGTLLEGQTVKFVNLSRFVSKDILSWYTYRESRGLRPIT